MDKIKHRYLLHFQNKDFLVSFISSILILLASLVVNFYAALYATEKAGNAVTDIILDNIRVYDVDGIFIYGPIVLWTFVAFILLAHPHKIPFPLNPPAYFFLFTSF